MMKEAATIQFIDAETSDKGCVIVRYDTDTVALCLSLESNGDIEISMKRQDAQALFAAMKTAIAGSRNQDRHLFS